MSDWLGKCLFVSLVGCIAYFVIHAPARVASQTPGYSAGNGGEVQMVSSNLPNGTQQLIVLDTRHTTMAVYQVEPTQGKLQLRSVRNLALDLQMEEFNATSPLPSELRQVKP